MVKISLRSPFNLNGVDIETQSAMLNGLLAELSLNTVLTNVPFFDSKSGEVYPDYDVCVNGQPYGALADGLNTKLKDGDKVEVVMIMLAGG